MRELSLNEVGSVAGGELTWSEGTNMIGALAVAGLVVGTGGVGLFGLAIWAACVYVD